MFPRVFLAGLLIGCPADPPSTSPPPTDGTTTPAEPPDARAPADRVVTVGEPETLDGSTSKGVSFTWTFGDGTTAAGATVIHTWTTPGHHVVFLEAEGADGTIDVDLMVVTATHGVSVTPRSAGPLAGDPDQLWAVLPDHDQVAIVDLHTRTIDRWIDTCDGPRTVSAHDGVWAVACPEGDQVEVFDVDGHTSRGVIDLPWGSRPYGVVVTGPDEAWVTLQGRGALAKLTLDPPGYTVVIDLEPDLRGLAAVDGRLLITRHRSPDDGGVLLRYDPATNGVERWSVPVDPGPDSDTNARGVPTYLQGVAVRPDGRVAALPGLKANLERGLVRDGLALTFETTARADLRTISLDGGDAPVGGQVDAALFDDRDLALAAVYSPLGDWLFVAHQGSEAVDVLDSYTMQRSGAIQGTGARPDGLWISDDGRELWVLASNDRSLGSWDVSNVGAPLSVASVDLQPPTGEALDPQVAAGQVIFGRSVDPRMSENGYLSCASCHLDGDSDGRTWDFTDRGEGLRNTISLLGHGGPDHGPLHWSANFDEVHDFEHDIRGPQQGDGLMTQADFDATDHPLGDPKAGLSADLDALAAYVTSLDRTPRSPHRSDDGSMTADAQLGEQLFGSPELGCVACHPPPTYTDSAWLAPGVPDLHDVGTLTPDSGGRLAGPLDGLDTPTLRGLHASAPYLHDGSAPTVRQVLVDRNPSDTHGVTSQLDDAQIDALVAFLLQLE